MIDVRLFLLPCRTGVVGRVRTAPLTFMSVIFGLLPLLVVVEEFKFGVDRLPPGCGEVEEGVGGPLPSSSK